MKLTFTVTGEPKPQGSKRGFVTRTGKVALVEQAGKPLKTWRNEVTLTAAFESENQGWTITDKPIQATITFRLNKPQRPKAPLPSTRPDLDKLIRAVLDAITAAHNIWVDDSQVVTLTARKTYGTPGVSVELTTS